MAVVLSENFVAVDDKTYEIKNLDGLKEFRDLVNGGETFLGKTVKLACDIDLEGSETNQWTPIGTSSAKFYGNFDGQNHTISNLYINNSSKSGVGFFGYTGYSESANTVSNIKFENATVVGDLYVAVVAGSPFVTSFDNIVVTGDVTVDARAYVAVVGGYHCYGDYTNIEVRVNEDSYVKGTYPGYSYAGGIIGHMGEDSCSLSGIYSNIDVEGQGKVGGIAGIAQSNSKFSDIEMPFI